MFEITADYPDIVTYYPILSGLAILLPEIFFGTFMGTITDLSPSRVKQLGFACLACSGCTFLSGEIDNFWAFVGLRVAFGVFTSSCNPPALSLLRDYFPKNFRSTANSVFLFGIYLGCSLSSVSVLLIKEYGWRADYEITAFFGAVVGILTLVILEDPERGQFDKPLLADI